MPQGSQLSKYLTSFMHSFNAPISQQLSKIIYHRAGFVIKCWMTYMIYWIPAVSFSRELEKPGNREPLFRNYLHLIHWTCLWGISLIANRCGRVQTTLGLSCIRKIGEQAKKAREQHSSKVSTPVTASRFRPWILASAFLDDGLYPVSQINSFLQKLVSVHCITAAEKQATAHVSFL